MFPIYLVPIGGVDWGILEYLRLTLRESFGCDCELVREVFDPGPAYLPHRQQYHSTMILAGLSELPGYDSSKILGVSDLDLCIPILTFVFGEAQVGDRNAVISVHRLRQEFYGLPEDESVFYARCEKEANHEAGHAFGLLHCSNFECVMASSNSIEQVDLKSSEFCSGCFRRLSQLCADPAAG